MNLATERHGMTRPEDRPRALVIDDDELVRHSYRLVLARAHFDVLEAPTGSAGIELTADEAPDVVLLDANLPDMDGVDVVRHLRDQAQSDVPILMVSGDDRVPRKVAGLQGGANDYLTKPVSPPELLARVRAAVDRGVRRRGRLDASLASRRRLADAIACLDPRSPWEMLVSSLRSTLMAELMCADVAVELLPTPKVVNAWTASAAPDPDSLQLPVRHDDQVFAVLRVTGVSDPSETRAVLDDVSPQLGTLLVSGAAAERTRRADCERVRGLFSSESIQPLFQPIVDLRSGLTVGFEGLSRFADGRPPVEHFQRAARVGLTAELELHALACIIEAAGALPDGARLSVNLSAKTLLERNLRPLLESAERCISLEITEHEHIDDYTAVSRVMAQLPDVVLSVDDAGSGYASLRHVYELRPDVIKLDQDWVRGLADDPVRQAMVTGMVAFASSLDAVMVGEGIEDRSDRDALLAVGVTHGQGYLLGRPAPAETFVEVRA